MGRITNMRYIIVQLSTPYVGTDDVRYLYTDMSDAEIEEYLREEAISHNEAFGYEFSDWMEENAPDTPEDEWTDYWDDYVLCVCECCGWSEVELEDHPEVDADVWEHL